MECSSGLRNYLDDEAAGQGIRWHQTASVSLNGNLTPGLTLSGTAPGIGLVEALESGGASSTRLGRTSSGPNADEEAMTLIGSALAEGEWIGDAARLRAGATVWCWATGLPPVDNRQWVPGVAEDTMKAIVQDTDLVGPLQVFASLRRITD